MKTLTTLAFVTLALVGCSSHAQIVRSDRAGGQVALDGAFMPAMSKAHSLMAEHCQGRFEAVAHGDAVSFVCRKAAPKTSQELAALDTSAL